MATFTAANNNNFFTNGPQMSLSATVRARLASEGLETVADFDDFKEAQLTQAYKNMRTSIPGVPGIAAVTDANGNITIPAVAPIPAIPPVLVSAKCALRLKVASHAFHYFIDIGREPTPANMNYSQVLKSFHVEYEAILKLAEESKPDVPTLQKNQVPIKWIESFKDCLFRTFGIRGCPLLYVIRENQEVPDEATDPLLPSKTFGSSGSVIDELINRLTHDDPLYKSDNATLYSMLEEATRGSIYASTVKPHSRKKDGRAAWMAMVSSHAGKDKWEQLQLEKTRFLMNTKWNGKTYSLEKFTGLHRSFFVQLQEAALHVNFQLPTEFTRVGYLINNITNGDPDLRAAIASIRINNEGMRDNFEDAVSFLLPVDPYSKSRAHGGRNNPQVSDTALQNKQQSKTGVDFRWHKPDEYSKLSKDQRIELYEWQSTKEGKAKTAKQRKESNAPNPTRSAKKKLQAKVSALEAQLKEAQQPEIKEIQAFIASVQQANLPPVPPVTPPVKPSIASATVALQQLLKRKRDE
jgi:hypothetical protein